MPDPLLAVALALLLTASVLGIAAVVLLWRLHRAMTSLVWRINGPASAPVPPGAPPPPLTGSGVGGGRTPWDAGRDHSEVRLADGDLLGRRERDSE